MGNETSQDYFIVSWQPKVFCQYFI